MSQGVGRNACDQQARRLAAVEKSVAMLRRIATALNRRVEIRFLPLRKSA